jgi:hypothetical protein
VAGLEMAGVGHSNVTSSLRGSGVLEMESTSFGLSRTRLDPCTCRRVEEATRRPTVLVDGNLPVALEPATSRLTASEAE